MARIFVSYNRANLDAVKAVAEDLAAAGNDVWYDQALTGGQHWWDNILKNIRDCDIFAFALTPEGLESQACQLEMAYAQRVGKPILPVLLSSDVKLSLLPRPLNEIQAVDYRKQDKPALFALMKAVVGAPAPAPLPDPLPEPPPVPLSYLTDLKERIDSDQALELADQLTLVFKLKERLQDPHAADDVVALLVRLRQRPDLLARVADDIDAVLRTVHNPRAPAARPPRSPPPGTDPSRPQPSEPAPPEKEPPAPTSSTPAPVETAPPPAEEKVRVALSTKAIEEFVNRVVDHRERWAFTAKEKEYVVLSHETGEQGVEICAKAQFRDPWDRRARAMKGLGWQKGSQATTRGIGAGAAIAATSGMAVFGLLSKTVRDYILTADATRRWPVPNSPGDVRAIAKDLEAALKALGAEKEIEVAQQKPGLFG